MAVVSDRTPRGFIPSQAPSSGRGRIPVPKPATTGGASTINPSPSPATKLGAAAAVQRTKTPINPAVGAPPAPRLVNDMRRSPTTARAAAPAGNVTTPRLANDMRRSPTTARNAAPVVGGMAEMPTKTKQRMAQGGPPAVGPRLSPVAGALGNMAQPPQLLKNGGLVKKRRPSKNNYSKR